MRYQHRWLETTHQDSSHCQEQTKQIDLPLGKIACVGRNYREHAKELNNPVPKEPLIFLKPSTALQSIESRIELPSGKSACHYECEIALLVGKPLSSVSSEEALNGIVGVGLGLDLTLRTLQSDLKQQGHPWELAKAFDGACPLSPFVKMHDFQSLSSMDQLGLSLCIDGVLRQRGWIKDMIFPIPDLLAYITQHFTLLPGDVVMTGTPAGVGLLKRQQLIEMVLLNDEVGLHYYKPFKTE